jgi:hypothetical protein
MREQMKRVVIGGLWIVVWMLGHPLAVTGADTMVDLQTVDGKYPGLASGALTYARLATLPEGVLLKAGALTVSETEVADRIAQTPQAQQEQLRKEVFRHLGFWPQDEIEKKLAEMGVK